MSEFLEHNGFDYFDIFQHQIGSLVEGKQYNTALKLLNECKNKILIDDKTIRDNLKGLLKIFNNKLEVVIKYN
jgi:hypothetical protein